MCLLATMVGLKDKHSQLCFPSPQQVLLHCPSSTSWPSSSAGSRRPHSLGSTHLPSVTEWSYLAALSLTVHIYRSRRVESSDRAPDGTVGVGPPLSRKSEEAGELWLTASEPSLWHHTVLASKGVWK